jgi:hypothetical protein
MEEVVKRKCPKCGTWNGNEDHCTNCGELLNYTLIRKKEDEKRVKEFSTRPPDSIDRFLNTFKNSSFILVRMVYYILYGVWFMFALIISGILYIVAAGPG